MPSAASTVPARPPYLTALLRTAQGAAAADVPLTFVIERPDGVEFRRTLVADQGLGGHSLTLALPGFGTDRHLARAHLTPTQTRSRRRDHVSVEDYVPDRIEFDLRPRRAGTFRKKSPPKISVAGRFLYGAPAADLDLEGELTITAAKERAGFAGYQFGLAMKRSMPQQPLADLPTTDAAGKATFPVQPRQKLPESSGPLEAQIAVRMAESGGRAVERKMTLPVTPSANMIGVKPLFCDARSPTAPMPVSTWSWSRPTAPPPRSAVCTTSFCASTRIIKFLDKRDGSWNYEPVKTTKRLADGTIDTTLDRAARISLPVNFGRYRLEVSTTDPNGPLTAIAFDAGFYVEANADTPDMLEVALDKGDYAPGDTMTVAVTARSAGRLTLNIVGDRLLAMQTTDVPQGVSKIKLPVGSDWSTGAYLVATLRRPLDAPAQRMPGRAIGVQWFRSIAAPRRSASSSSRRG